VTTGIPYYPPTVLLLLLLLRPTTTTTTTMCLLLGPSRIYTIVAVDVFATTTPVTRQTTTINAFRVHRNAPSYTLMYYTVNHVFVIAQNKSFDYAAFV
jgi:hypothetical protein